MPRCGAEAPALGEKAGKSVLLSAASIFHTPPRLQPEASAAGLSLANTFFRASLHETKRDLQDGILYKSHGDQLHGGLLHVIRFIPRKIIALRQLMDTCSVSLAGAALRLERFKDNPRLQARCRKRSPMMIMRMRFLSVISVHPSTRSWTSNRNCSFAGNAFAVSFSPEISVSSIFSESFLLGSQSSRL